MLLQCVELSTIGGPLVRRKLEMLVNEEDESITIIMDRHLMEKMGYSVMAILEGARKKKSIWLEEKETKHTTPGFYSLQVREDKLFEDEPSDEQEEYLFAPELEPGDT